RDAYIELKNKIGRIPYLTDYIENHSIDPIVIADKHSNYYQFLLKMKEEIPTLTRYEDQVLTMLSLEILNGKRKHEIVLFEMLLDYGIIAKQDYVKQLSTIGCRIDRETILSVNRIFDLSFFTQS